MSGWQARAATEAKRAHPEGEPERRSLRISPRGRTFDGDEAAAYLVDRDFPPVTRPAEVGAALERQHARASGRRGRHAN